MKTAALASTLALLAGCGTGSPAGMPDAAKPDAPREAATPDAGVDAALACVSDLVNGCVDPTPSYKADIVPILQARCAPCHFDGGVEDFMFDFSTYDSVDNADVSIQNQIYFCYMPPTQGIPKMHVAPAPALSDTQRKTLWNWLKCGAPDN